MIHPANMLKLTELFSSYVIENNKPAAVKKSAEKVGLFSSFTVYYRLLPIKIKSKKVWLIILKEKSAGLEFAAVSYTHSRETLAFYFESFFKTVKLIRTPDIIEIYSNRDCLFSLTCNDRTNQLGQTFNDFKLKLTTSKSETNQSSAIFKRIINSHFNSTKELLAYIYTIQLKYNHELLQNLSLPTELTNLNYLFYPQLFGDKNRHNSLVNPNQAVELIEEYLKQDYQTTAIKAQYTEVIAQIYNFTGNRALEISKLIEKAMYLDLDGKKEKAFKELSELLQISHTENLLDQSAEAYYGLGYYFLQKGDLIKCRIYYRKAIHLFKQTKNLNQLYKAYRLMARLKCQLGQHRYACRLLQALNKRMADSTNILLHSDILNDLGSVYYSLKDYNNALEFYQKNLILLQNAGLHVSIMFLINLTNCYFALKDYANSELYCQKALRLLKREKQDPATEAIPYYSLANLLCKIKRKPSLIKYYQKSIDIYTELQDTRSLIIVKYNLALFYYAGSQLRKCRDLTRSTLKEARRYGDDKLIDLLLKLWQSTSTTAKSTK